MEKRPHNIDSLPRDTRGGYRVPESYFSDLNQKIIAHATATSEKASFWSRFRGVKITAGAFALASLVLVAGISFFGLSDHTSDKLSELEEYSYFIDLYGVTTEDIIDLQTQSNPIESSSYAEAAIEYIDLAGCDIIDIETE